MSQTTKRAGYQAALTMPAPVVMENNPQGAAALASDLNAEILRAKAQDEFDAGKIELMRKSFRYSGDRYSVVMVPGGGDVSGIITSPQYINLINGGAPDTTKFKFSRSIPSIVTNQGYPVSSVVWASPHANLVMNGYRFRLNVEFYHTGKEIAFNGIGGAAFRVFVDGLPLNNGDMNTIGNNGNKFGVCYKFSQSRTRHIRCVSGGLAELCIGQTDAISLVPDPSTPPKKMLVVGDSFLESSAGGDSLAGPSSLTGVCDYIEYLTGFEVYNNAAGGTGFNNAGISYKYGDRISFALSAASFDYVLLCASTNDGVNSTVSSGQAVINTIKAAQPSAKIFLFGPFQNGLPSSSAIAVQAGSMKQLAASNTLDYIGEPEAESWLSANNQNLVVASDNLHPSAAGQFYYGYKLGSAILKAVLKYGKQSINPFPPV